MRKIPVSRGQLPAFKSQAKRLAKAVHRLTGDADRPRKSNREDLLAFACGYENFSQLSLAARPDQGGPGALVLANTPAKRRLLRTRLTQQSFCRLTSGQAEKALAVLPCPAGPIPKSHTTPDSQIMGSTAELLGERVSPALIKDAEQVSRDVQTYHQWTRPYNQGCIAGTYLRLSAGELISPEDWLSEWLEAEAGSLGEEDDSLIEEACCRYLESGDRPPASSPLWQLPSFARLDATLRTITPDVERAIERLLGCDVFLPSLGGGEYEIENPDDDLGQPLFFRWQPPKGSIGSRSQILRRRTLEVVVRLSRTSVDDFHLLQIYRFSAYLVDRRTDEILSHTHGYLTGMKDVLDTPLANSDFFCLMDAVSEGLAETADHIIQEALPACDGEEIFQAYVDWLGADVEGELTGEGFAEPRPGFAIHLDYWEVAPRFRGLRLGREFLWAVLDGLGRDSQDAFGVTWPYGLVTFVTLRADPLPTPRGRLWREGISDPEQEAPARLALLQPIWERDKARLGSYLRRLECHLGVPVTWF